MNYEARMALLAALREIYDGSWTRHVGVDGGKTLKCAIIAGCTPRIDKEHAVMASMGERFVLFRFPEVESRETGRDGPVTRRQGGGDAPPTRASSGALF